jgi:hypothetical protein
MKKQIFVAMAVVVTVAFAGELSAQDATETITKQRTKSNNPNERTVGASKWGNCVGKIRCADGSCSITFEQEIVSPRDAASGLPTGKRMHKPFVITKELDKTQPASAKTTSGMGAGKATFSDLSVMVNVNGKSKNLDVVNGQFSLQSDGKDDDCDVIVSWSFGGSHASTSAVTKDSGISRYQATFNLAVENGEYMASKKEYVGHVTLIKQ